MYKTAAYCLKIKKKLKYDADMKKFFLIINVCLCTLYALCAQSFFSKKAFEPFIADSENPDCIYAKALLGDCIIHMKKITTPFKGSAPAIEMLSFAQFCWQPAKPLDGWGKEGKTFSYYEDVVPGTPIIFSITNKINDVYYYKTEGVHPCALPMYEEGAGAQMLKRFIFFKFTGYADKNGTFENYLDNYLYALDTHTKLLYSYGMPTEFKRIMGNNYIPLNWQAYEIAPNTKADGVKFYEYDPVGFVSLENSYEFFKIKTNMHIYEWWYESITAGKTMEEIKAKRFMPVINPDAEKDWTIRNAAQPVVSPYRKQ